MKPSVRQEELQLFDAACSNQLDSEQHEELKEILRDSDESRSNYLDYMSMHSDLRNVILAARVREKFTQYLDQEATEDAVADAIVYDSALSGLASAIKEERTPWRFDPVWGISTLTLAATLLIAIVSHLQQPGDIEQFVSANVEESLWPDSIAKINRIESVVWDPGSPSYELSEPVSTGETLFLNSGLVELEFRRGAVVVLEGPARLVANSGNHATLIGGKLAAYAPSWTKGFRVDTPGVDVIEHGTEFAVNVCWDEADPTVNVVVTEGEVEVLHQGLDDSSKRIKAGSGISASGTSIKEATDPETRDITDHLKGIEYLKNATVIDDRWHSWLEGVEGEPRREGNWRYFTNETASFGAPAFYTELIWDSRTNSYRPPSYKDGTNFSQYVKVHRDGGHPGQGSEQSHDGLDHYSITAYEVPADGVYRLESGWLERLWTKNWNLDEVLDIAVHVNDGPILMNSFCNRGSFVSFRSSLGALRAGDVIYIGVGPNGVNHNDRFRWSFFVVRENDEFGLNKDVNLRESI